MNSKLLYKNYIFLEKINDLVKENLLKFSNINIIIDINHDKIKKSENALSIINFARKNKEAGFDFPISSETIKRLKCSLKS